MRHATPWIVLCSLAGSPAAAEEGAAAARIMEALRAANAARAENAKEEQSFRLEQERLRLVADTIEQQIALLERDAKEAQAGLRALSAKRAQLDPSAARRERIEAFASEQAAKIDEALDALARELPPGVIPARAPASARFDDATRRLETSEKHAEQTAVELAEGWLDGEARAVELLRVGAVVAWWRAFDGSEGGPAAMKDGRLELRRAPEHLASIALAADIVKGRRAPALMSLPVAHARRAP